jgi:hypothetical protein
MNTTQITIDIEGEEYEALIEYCYTPEVEGVFHGPIENAVEPQSEEWELISLRIQTDDGGDWDASNLLYVIDQDLIIEKIKESAE